MQNDVLLTVSGTIPSDIRQQIADGKRPLADYIAMADHFEHTDLIDYPTALEKSGWFGQLLQKLGGNALMLAWYCFVVRKQYKVIFTDGEQIGLPLALFLKFFGGKTRPQHLMIVHILSVGKKQVLIDTLGLQSHVDIFFVYATRQKEFIQDRWNVPADRVPFTPFMVDESFFHRSQVDLTQQIDGFEKGDKPLICAVGLEFRDYPTLIDAVRGLDAHIVIAAGSPWSKRSDSTADQDIPDNVTVKRFTQHELRQIYAMSEFLAMPLYDVEFQAGVTALLEAMSMEKAVVCSLTKGQTDVVDSDKSGIYVTPGNVTELRTALEKLLEDRDLSAEMGRNGRKIIDDYMSLTHYKERLKVYVDQARAKAE